MIVDRLRDLEAAAAHVAHRPYGAKKSRDHAERRVARLFLPGEDANLEPALPCDCRRQSRSIGRAAHRLGRGRVDPAYAHRIGNGAKPAHRLNGLPKAFGRNGARLRQPLAQPQQRFFVEARHRRAAKLVIDHEPDRIGSDIDDRIGRPRRARNALGIELERSLCGFAGSGVFVVIALLRRNPIMRDDDQLDQPCGLPQSKVTPARGSRFSRAGPLTAPLRFTMQAHDRFPARPPLGPRLSLVARRLAGVRARRPAGGEARGECAARLRPRRLRVRGGDPASRRFGAP